MCFTTIFKADNNLLNVILERASMLIKIAYKFDASDFSPYIYNNTYLSLYSLNSISAVYSSLLFFIAYFKLHHKSDIILDFRSYLYIMRVVCLLDVLHYLHFPLLLCQ